MYCPNCTEWLEDPSIGFCEFCGVEVADPNG